jgi:iron complex outermembrane receptor protein
MRSYLLILLSALTATVQINAQNYLTGKITDRSGTPLSGASIIIHDAATGAVAAADGSYKTGPVNAGNYLVEIGYTGYQSIVQTINIKGATERNFTLNSSVREQEAVIVTGVSSATRLKLNPQPVSVLRRDELINVPSTNIINALTRIPGVNAVTTGPAISKPFIRGLGYNRVVTINDGIRQEGQQWGDEHGIEIDDYSVQRAEVLKGPASLIYGSDALAGVVNLISFVPAPNGKIRGEIISEYQTNNKLRGFYGNLAGTNNGFTWNAYGSYKGASDYKNKFDGRVFNSKFRQFNFGGTAGLIGSWGHSYVTASNFNQFIGMIEGERDPVTGEFLKALPGGGETVATNEDFNAIDPFVPYQNVQHFKISNDTRFNIKKGSIDVLLGYQSNQRKEFGDPDNTKEPEAWFDLKTLSYSAKYTFPYHANWKTSFGLSGMQQTNKNRTEEAIIPNYDLFDIGAFVFGQYTKNKISFSGGLRYDNRRISSERMITGGVVKFREFEKDFSNISGSAGISYEASHELTLKLNIARGFRAPSLAELSSNGAHEGTTRYEIGNTNLRSETSMQIDAGLEFNTEHISVGVSAFYNHIKDFIFYRNVLNAAGGDSILTDPSTGDQFNVFRYSQHTANLVGAEMNFDIHPHPLDWLHIENRFSYTKARFTEMIGGTKNVPLIPAARLLTDVRADIFTKQKSLRNAYINLESDYTFKQDDAFTGFDTETETGSYWLINASVGTDFISKKGTPLFSLQLAAQNLTDIAYQNHLSRLKYLDDNAATGRRGVFNMGRNFAVKLRVPLNL